VGQLEASLEAQHQRAEREAAAAAALRATVCARSRPAG
jgi:hypothetical protein